MAFNEHERSQLLALKGVGPTVLQRLEQLGYHSLAQLAEADAGHIVQAVASLVGSSCWKNSPQARAAIQATIAHARLISGAPASSS
ncbi:helix-hairpin-helix domain-containing protein [Pseudomonas xanthosomatis]|uniref:helix-hairpin-helix domain-containing protein n=1 Tax=Pseudomonas xanthosomatis TaxID=2842356 RepID=UPI001C3E8485|nr:helix-hairpin-helix domain-containing protein [Pseudomonas xanthosomatis]QXH44109.1 helix-hairpin-helix domain-containing protein [Pseudomonas xanthosomatis]